MKSHVQKNGSRIYIRCALAVSIAVVATGCATSSPVLMPPSSGKGAALAARAIDSCRSRADQQIGRNALSANHVQHVAKAGAIDLADGLADGAVAGSSKVVRRAFGAASGGASAAAIKILLEWNEPDKAYQKYVEYCLEKSGYRVLGWR